MAPAGEDEFARWMAALADARSRTLERLAGLGDGDLGRGEPNTIGSVLYHVAAIEADYLFDDILGEPAALPMHLFPYDVREEGGVLTPALDGGRVLDVRNVIWCTGHRETFDWIDVDTFDEHGAPLHDRGVARGAAGLYFMGLNFLFAASSDSLPGMGRDAAYIARHIASRNTRAVDAARVPAISRGA